MTLRCRTNDIYPLQFKILVAMQVPAFLMMHYFYRNNFFLKPEFCEKKETLSTNQKYFWFCQPAEDREYSKLEMFEN
jgi:hypothetical protein